MFKTIVFIIFIIFITQSFAKGESAQNFLMLKNNKVNVRYGPSLKSPIKFVYKKMSLPVKIIDKKDNFRKVIDYQKNNGWIHISQLKKSKSVITISEKILFKNPTKYSKPIAKIKTGRLLIIQKCKNGWCKIKTDDYIGWVNKEKLWGVNIN